MVVAGVSAFLLATALAACGSGSDTGTGSGSSPSLTVDIGGEPGTLDPLLSADGQLASFDLSVYQGLTARTPGGALAPSLATKWHQQGNAWIFDLRHDIKFQNGDPMTSADVVASWNAVKSPKSENRDSFVLSDTKITAINKYTVSVARPSPDATTPARASLVMIAPASMAENPTQLDSTMMGTGPYKFVKWDRGNSITLATSSDYWGKKPSIPSVTMRFSPEAAVRLSELQAGEAQMVLSMPSQLNPHDSKYKLVGASASEVLIGRFNTKHGPFMNEDVRKAAAYAIDRASILKNVFDGYAQTSNGQEVESTVFGYSPKVSELYNYNLAKAKSLLQSANAVGTKITVLGQNGRYIHDVDMDQAVAHMLTLAGFDVNLETPPTSQFLSSYLKGQSDPSGAPDLALLNTSNQLFDAAQTFHDNLTCDAPASATCFPALDKLVDKADQTQNPKARLKVYTKAWQYAESNAMYISIGVIQHISFLTSNLQWQKPSDGFLRFQDMSFS
jgi:peptide/nickel transport system substrate-binding protein